MSELDPLEALQDPEFKAMPLEDQRRILRNIDPEDFGKLTVKEQDRVLLSAGQPFKPESGGVEPNASVLKREQPEIPAKYIPGGKMPRTMNEATQVLTAHPYKYDEYFEPPGSSTAENALKAVLKTITPDSLLDSVLGVVSGYGVKKILNKLPAPTSSGTKGLPSGGSNIDEMLKLRHPTWGSRLDEAAYNSKEALKAAFIPDHEVAKFPTFRNDLRLLKSEPTAAQQYASDKLRGILDPLDQGGNKGEYQLFRKIAILRDLQYTAQQGKQLPRGLTPNEVDTELQAAYGRANDTVKEAVKRHDELMDEVGADLVQRGRLSPPEQGELGHPYYPHHVLDYMESGAGPAFIPQKLHRQFRAYTKAREGSEKDIDVDYIGTMHQHLAKYHMDNAIEDFALKHAEQLDATPLAKAAGILGQSRQTRQVLPGERITLTDPKLGEHTFVGWQFRPGRVIYPGSTTTEEKVVNAIAQDMSVEEFADHGLFQKAGIMGRHFKTYLLPEEVANKLDNAINPRQVGPVESGLKNFMALWKRWTLNIAATVPYQVGNLVGDLINLYRVDPKALLELPSVSKQVLEQSPIGEALRKQLGYSTSIPKSIIYQEAEKQKALGEVSGFSVELRPRQQIDPALARFYGTAEKIKASYLNPMRLIRDLSAIREDIPRLAKFQADVKRIQRGEHVVTDVDVRGLDPYAAAGRASRIELVDYGDVSNTEANARLIFPFLTFYVKNAENWARYVAKRPGDAAIKFGVPVGLMYEWNNSDGRDRVEARLPDYYRWMPHINTGWKTKDGKDIIYALTTPVDMAAKTFGLDRLLDKAVQVREGNMTAKEAAEEQFKDTFMGLPRLAEQLHGPLTKTIEGLATNKDPLTGRAIVPERMKGTSHALNKQAEFVLGQLFTPYAAYVRTESILDTEHVENQDEPSLLGPIKRFAWLGPLREPFTREVDPVAAANRAISHKREQLTGDRNEQLMRVEQAVLQAVESRAATVNPVNGKLEWKPEAQKRFNEAIQAVVEHSKEGGVPITGEEIQKRIMNPRMALDIYTMALRQSEREGDRQLLLKRINTMRQLLATQRARKDPLGVKVRILPQQAKSLQQMSDAIQSQEP